MSQRFLIRSIGTILLVAPALAGCGSSPPDPRTLPPLVRVMQPAASEGPTTEFTGIVASRIQSDLGFRVSGKVEARFVDAGQVVRRGQPLMRLDSTDLGLAAKAALASLAAARAKALQTAADELRFRNLVGSGAVSASNYDQAKAAADAARGQLTSTKAQADIALHEARYSVLVADADGTVVSTLADPGQVVAAGQVVMRLAHAGPREALVQLPETVRPAIGSIAQARTYGGAKGQASLRQLSDAADPVLRTFDARYVLSGEAARAPLGSTVTLSFPRHDKVGMIEVPLGAIHDAGQGPGVWLIKRGRQPTVTWRPVRISALAEETATISAGLKPNDRFVSMGAHMLHQGQRVRVAAR